MSFLICCFPLSTCRCFQLAPSTLGLSFLGASFLCATSLSLLLFVFFLDVFESTLFSFVPPFSALLFWENSSFGTISSAGAVTEGVFCAKEVPRTEDAPANRLVLVGLMMSSDFTINETPPWLPPKLKSCSNREGSKAFLRARARNVPENLNTAVDVDGGKGNANKWSDRD